MISYEHFNWVDQGSPYVVAGVQTIPSLFRHLDKHTTIEQINSFVTKTNNKWLISFGEALSYKNPKIPKNHLENFIKKTDEVWNSGYFGNNILTIDSGGFQIAGGAVPKTDVEKFTELYCELISKRGDIVFSMDVPPHAGTFENYDEIFKFNKYTYNKLGSLPPEVVQKILCVFHFRTVDLFKVWDKLFTECECWDKFKLFSIGGLVGFGTMSATENIVPYVIPIDKIVRKAVERNKKEIYIHILGSTSSFDLLFYGLLKRMYKHHLGIDLYMTFDSSKIFKGIIKGKYFEVVKEGQLHKIVYKSIEQNRKLKGIFEGKSAIDILKEEMLEIQKYGIAPHEDFDDMYNYEKEGYPIKATIQSYIVLQTIKNSKDIYDLTDKYAEELFEDFKKDERSFVNKAITVLKNLNNEKMTDSVRGKAISLSRSLQFIQADHNREEAYLEMIGKVFGKREIHGMQDNGVLSWG